MVPNSLIPYQDVLRHQEGIVGLGMLALSLAGMHAEPITPQQERIGLRRSLYVPRQHLARHA